jgi:hypothetical protein
MRIPKYLSPTSISLWNKDRREFYLYYLADNRPPRIPQNQPMAIGAAFDAYIKSYLYGRLYGTGFNDTFDFKNLFETQVESQNRDWALEHGRHVFQSYQKSGALADLLLDLNNATSDPQFEMQIEGRILHSACVEGIPLLGKPDIHFINKHGSFIVHDWKVNGYCSKSTTSPKKGFTKIYDAYVAKSSKNNMQAHKDCQLMLVDGVNVNIAHYLEEIESSWAMQTAIYSWILGAEIGSKFTVAIDQIVCKGSDTEFPYLRIAAHRNRISSDFQNQLHDTIANIWNRVNRGANAIFDDLTPEESSAKCEILDLVYESYQDDHPHKDWFNEEMRSHKNY